MMATGEERPNRFRGMSRDESKTNVPSPPMHVAIMNRDLKKLQEMVQSKEQQLHPVTKETPLHVAARIGAIECVKWLLDNQVNSHFVKDRDGSTPGHYCAVYGQLEALKELLARDKKGKHELAKSVDENGLSIMALATLQNDLQMVTWIMENYPEMRWIKDLNGDLPIHFAAAGGSIEMVKLLVQKYGRQYAEEADLRNIRPVYYAAQNGKLNILQYLLTEVKVDSKVREKGGMTIVHAATTGHQLHIVKWLVEHLGPKIILSRSYDGATPLHIAAAQGYTDILEYFLENLEDLSDMNVTDDIQATPAHDAAEFGELNSLLVLLRHGADISIKDKENKTPFDLAKEKNHTQMLSMIKNYREKGLSGLMMYEDSDLAVDHSSSNDLLRRSTVILNAKQEANNLMEKRKDETVTRKISLLKLDEDVDYDSSDELEKQLMQPRKDRARPIRTSEDSSTIPHELGPEGELYAVPKKGKQHLSKKHRSRERLSDVDSQASFVHQAQMTNGFGDPGLFYKAQHHNLETASNFSRPSRVKYYDSSSSVGSSVSQKMEGGRSHVPGFYPGTVPPNMLMPPQRGMPSPAMGPGGGYPYPGYQYPPFPAMVAEYYGLSYPQLQQGKPKTTSERMHMEALQKSGHQMFGQQMFGPPPSALGYPPMYYHPRHVGSLYGRGRGRMRPASGRSSIRSVPVNKHMHGHPKRDIGFGPTSASDDQLKNKAAGHNSHKHRELHPPPPPITKQGKLNEQKELQSVDDNFIMVQADVEGRIPLQASEGTQLHRAKTPKVYDGRYDQYIETDSEEEKILDEHISVSTLGECALILALGPICGVMGIKTMRRKESKKIPPPEEFAELEAQKTSKQWGSRDNVTGTQEIELREDSLKSKLTEPDDLTSLLGISAGSFNKPITGQFIGGSIGARQKSMKQLKTSLFSSVTSLQTADDDDDDEDEIISVVAGETGKKNSKSKLRSKESRKKNKKKDSTEKESKKKKKKMIVKPTKKKEKEKNKDIKLQPKASTEESESGPVEKKNFALFDSSESENDKKKRKKKKRKEEKELPSQTSEEEEIDEMLDLAKKELEEIANMYYPEIVDMEAESKAQATAIEKVEQMFPQHQQDGGNNNSLPKELTDKIKNDVIASLIKGDDPELKKKLMQLASDSDGLGSSSNTQLLDEITSQMREAEQKQQRQAQQQSMSMQQKLDENLKMYKEEIQAMLQQEFQKQKKEQEHLHHYAANSDTSDTDTDMITAIVTPTETSVKYKADIVVQEPLKWDDFDEHNSVDKIFMPPKPPSLKLLLNNVNDTELKLRLFEHKRPPRRKGTAADLRATESALHQLMKNSLPLDQQEESAM